MCSISPYHAFLKYMRKNKINSKKMQLMKKLRFLFGNTSTYVFSDTDVTVLSE